ncbi:OB-fold nucleic acid binding domain-containing protein [Streptomyces sp. HUAS TT20]|uniref:OB-fold nucleic acid binding domain-containing protein n=1 Tax=Streptomyces sp. HUAS TT20 TaxID=3447509 RepID=UPI0021D9473B|nr:OB-fold nucleic acid binding domain-containing protein [Streptomyces sp. HUAS 15-9]UXY33246.1 OB-fold nucleic acid binding domain-containing protein [Streptomyces sp. HUAS 15-9]
MEKARLYQDGKVGKRVFAHEIDDEPWWRREKIPLICAFCMTRVVSQRTTVGRAPRAALFRLAQDRQHEDICPLNPTEVLQKIAHGSQGVAVIEGDELHLVLPDDLGQIDTGPTVDTGPAAPGDPFGVNISTVRPLLPPLINSAVVIARFLQKHDYDPDVVAQFKVRRPGEAQTVGWGEFCHGPASGDHARLYARLTGAAKPEHPVAVYGRVTAVERDSQKRPVLRLADGRGFTVRIRSEHASFLNPLAPGSFVLAVGTWKVWTPRRGRPELQMFAEEHWQLAHWTYDAATGRSSRPACPPPLSLAQRTLQQTRSAAAARKPGPGRAARLSPRPPRPSGPPTSDAPPPTATPPVPPTTAVPPPAASPAPPTPPSPPGPVVPDEVPTEPAPPARPPVPPRPSTPPRPAAPPRRRTRRSWWPFGRQR